jgi:hypothetical protein
MRERTRIRMDKLYCFLCLLVRNGIANNAITIVRGSAVCMEHLGYLAANAEVSELVELVKEREGR